MGVWMHSSISYRQQKHAVNKSAPELSAPELVVSHDCLQVNPNLTLLSFSQAMANTMYSYAGHWMYFEIMSEMETPVDFPKVL